jgi:hypothetical protein
MISRPLVAEATPFRVVGFYDHTKFERAVKLLA